MTMLSTEKLEEKIPLTGANQTNLKNESTQTRRVMFPGFVALVDE
jgi:hypothetical protein